MKFVKIISICLAVCVLLSACSQNSDDVQNNNNTVKNSEKKEIMIYSFNELDEFFNGRELIDAKFKNVNELKYSDVLKKFGEAHITDSGYTVFPVKEGGKYYVFWSNIMGTVNSDKGVASLDETSVNTNGYNKAVYFTAYLSNERTEDDFKNLKTAKDVLNVDPYAQFDLLRSSGIFSYSYLNESHILEIEYSNNSENISYESLAVKKITVRERTEGLSLFGSIQISDLPTQA